MKKIVKLSLILLILLAGIFFATTYNWKAGMHEPLLVIDSNDDELPKSYRTMQDDFNADVSKEGLEKIHASGSAAFSAKQLQAIREKLKDKKITVVDLRQESHVYINGDPVSWYGVANAANRGKSEAEVQADEKAKIAAIAEDDKLSIADILGKSGGVITNYSTAEVDVHELQSEEEMVKALGMDYKRFAVRDHARPSDVQIDEYIKLIRDLPEGQWLHVHCRGGKGRTTTFLAIYDMMKNAKTVSAGDIIAWQYAIGGSDLLKISKGSYKQEDGDERADFLFKFHQYAKENGDGFASPWSVWKGK
jgi:hypothetical protein